MIDTEGMFDRASAWLLRPDGTAVTRDNAINEEHMALDVMALLDEIERLLAIPASSSTDQKPLTKNQELEAARNGEGPSPTRVIAEQLANKNITPEVIAGYEMIQTAVTALLVSADLGAAKNYVEITLDGVRAPFDRAAIHLIRPGGKTPHELRLAAESATRGVQVEVQFAQSTIEDRERALSQVRVECERWRIDTGLLVHEMHEPKDGESVVDCVLRTIATLRKYNAERTQALARWQPVIEAAKKWRIGRDRNIVGTAPAGGSRSETGRALIDALDHAISQQVGEG